MIMSKNTCHLLPIFREGGWEWALQGRLELSLDPTPSLFLINKPLLTPDRCDDERQPWPPPSFVRRCGEYAHFVFFNAPLFLSSVRRRG